VEEKKITPIHATAPKAHIFELCIGLSAELFAISLRGKHLLSRL
jgi:hypothetical protein